MAEGRRGDTVNPDHSEQNQKGVAESGGGSGAPIQGHKEDAEASEVEGEEKTRRIWLGITLRRVRIDPRKKRVSYIRRLEKIMKECDKIISDPTGWEDIQLRAMAILMRAIQICYDLVTDEQVEALEEEFERIKRKITERLRGAEAEP